MNPSIIKNSNPTLSILVPTYNRPNELIKTIESLVGNNVEYDFEIIIGDNSEDEKTKIKLINFLQNSPINNVKYIKNEENIGPLLNIINLISNSRSKYFWILADDDIVKPRIIKTIQKIINTNRPDYIYINYDVETHDSKIKNKSVFGQNNESNKFVFCEPNEFLLKLNLSFSFMSANVFSKDLIPSNNKFEKLISIDSKWPHVWFLFNAINKGYHNFFVISEELITQGYIPLSKGRREKIEDFSQIEDHYLLSVWELFILIDSLSTNLIKIKNKRRIKDLIKKRSLFTIFIYRLFTEDLIRKRYKLFNLFIYLEIERFYKLVLFLFIVFVPKSFFIIINIVKKIK